MTTYLLPDGGTIALGTHVRFSAVLSRGLEIRADLPFPEQYRKRWHRMDLSRSTVVKEGIVVGVRTLNDGFNEYNGYDEPLTYHAEDYFRAVLISTDLRSRPVFARFEDVEVLQPEPSAGVTLADEQAAEVLSFYPYADRIADVLGVGADRHFATIDPNWRAS